MQSEKIFALELSPPVERGMPILTAKYRLSGWLVFIDELLSYSCHQQKKIAQVPLLRRNGSVYCDRIFRGANSMPPQQFAAWQDAKYISLKQVIYGLLRVHEVPIAID